MIHASNVEPKQKSVRINWFLSYLLVLVVPLILCLLLYLYTANIITRESEKSFGSALDQVTIDLDAYLNEVDQVLEYVLLDTNVQRTTAISDTPTAYDQLKLMDAMTSLRTIQFNHPHLNGVFVALNDIDGLIGSGGYMSQSVFHSTQFGDDFSLEEMQALFHQSYPTWVCVPVPKKDGRTALWFLRSTLNTAGGKNRATAFVSMDLDVFADRLESFVWDDGMGVCILDEKQEILCQAGTVFSALPDSFPESAQFFFEKERGLLSAPSRANGWRYVLCVSRDLILRNTHSVQLVAWLGMMACISLGLLLSRYLTSLNYHPLGDLVKWMSSQEGTSAADMRDKDEFEQLNCYVRNYYRQRGDDQHMLWNNQQALCRYFVYSLLHQPKSDEATREAIRANRLQLNAEWHIVVLLSLPNSGGGNLQSNMTSELLQFAVLNIFSDLLSEDFERETTDVGGVCAAVVSMDDPSAATIAVLEEDIRRTVQKVQEIFHCSLRAACGTPKETLEGIYYSYAEALEALSYLQNFAGDEIIAYQDICDARQAYNFPLELEHRLIDLTQAGDSEHVAELVRKAFPVTGSAAVKSPAVARSLAYDISSALIKGASQAGINHFSDIGLAGCEGNTPEEWQNYLTGMAALLCDRVRHTRPERNPSGQLCENVRQFIRDHYSDPDLNISQTSLHFDMTPAYLSSVFKRETGQSLLDYIWTVRLDHVKEQLGKGIPLSRIAAETGFRDSSALIRIFKKYTGLTPGQYRADHFSAALEP